jgi:parallel beta helix pectate lyase-like protein
VKSTFISVALVGLFTGVVLSVPLAVQAQTPAQVPAPAMLIDKPGVYTLANDLIVAGGDAIMITASGVTLDLAGHNVVITTPGQGRGIVVQGAKGIRIANGKVHQFAVNVLLDHVENVTVEGLQIVGANLPLLGAAGNPADPRASGGPGFSEVGVLLIDTRGAVVRNNTITSQSAGIFNRGGGAVGSRFENNTITGGPVAAQDFLGICFNPLPSEGTAGPSGCLIEGNHIGHYNFGTAYQGVDSSNISKNNTLAVWGMAYFYPDVNADNNKKNTTIVNDTVVQLPAP